MKFGTELRENSSKPPRITATYPEIPQKSASVIDLIALDSSFPSTTTRRMLNSLGGNQLSQFTAIKAKPFLLFLSMVGVMILLTTFYLISHSGGMEDKQIENFQKLTKTRFVTQAGNLSSIPNGAFAFLAMGAQANQLNCPAAVESLVKYGGWDGEIYLITDQPSCFDEEEITKNAGMEYPEKFHLVSAKQSLSKGGIDLQHPKVGFRKSRVHSFAMKAQLFEYITDPNIDIVAYVDCDILFTGADCPRKFIEAGAPWKENMIKFGHLLVDRETGQLNGLHAGTLVVHREYSANIMKLWKDEILSGNQEGDNDAFMDLYRRHDKFDPQNPVGKRPEGFQGEFIFPPNDFTLSSLLYDMKADSESSYNRFERFFDPPNIHVRKDVACMTHISKARCNAYGRDVVQSFVDQFHLKTYKDGEYYYCTHPALQTFLYGWFPFGYLPFCPKMETLL